MKNCIFTRGLPSQRNFVHLCCVFLFFVGCGNLISANFTMMVSELAFSEKLTNPCALVNASRLNRAALSQENTELIHRVAIQKLKIDTVLLKDNADNILKTNFFKDCASLDLPLVALIPSADVASEHAPLTALQLFYTSLLNHTTQVYFVADQLEQRDSTCSTPELATNVRQMSSGLRNLMCLLRLGTLTLQSEDDENDAIEDSTNRVLNGTFTDQTLCSRRSLRDCQAVGSTAKLLGELSNYLDGQITMVSTTVLFEDLITVA